MRALRQELLPHCQSANAHPGRGTDKLVQVIDYINDHAIVEFVLAARHLSCILNESESYMLGESLFLRIFLLKLEYDHKLNQFMSTLTVSKLTTVLSNMEDEWTRFVHAMDITKEILRECQPTINMKTDNYFERLGELELELIETSQMYKPSTERQQCSIC